MNPQRTPIWAVTRGPNDPQLITQFQASSVTVILPSLMALSVHLSPILFWILLSLHPLASSVHHCKFQPLPWKKGRNLYNIGPVHPRGSSPPFSNTLTPLLQQFSSHVLLLLYRNGNCYNHNTMLLVFISPGVL